MSIDFDKMTRNFLLGENRIPPGFMSYVQSLGEILNRLTPRTMRELRDLEIAKEHLREIKRGGRKLMEENQQLQEKIGILEEEKNSE